MKELHNLHPDCVFVSPVLTFSPLLFHVSMEEGRERSAWLLEQCDEMWVYGDPSSDTEAEWEVQYCIEHKIPYDYML